MKLLSALAADARQSLQRLVVVAGLALAAVLSAAVALGFVTSALFVALRVQYGAIIAALVVAVLYLILAAVLFLDLSARRPADAGARGRRKVERRGGDRQRAAGGRDGGGT